MATRHFFAAFLTTVLVSAAAFAQSADDKMAKVSNTASDYDVQMWAMLGAGIAIGLAVLGGGLGQGRAASAALEGIARNPGAAARIQTPMILGLALIESLVLFAFLIAFLLMNRIPTPIP